MIGLSATKSFVTLDFIVAKRKAEAIERAAALGQGGLRGRPGPKDEFVPRHPLVEDEVSRQGGQTESTDLDTGRCSHHLRFVLGSGTGHDSHLRFCQ